MLSQRPAQYDFTRYLLAKRSVDDRALNQRVWQALLHAMSSRALQSSPLTLLELGGGMGAMFERLIRAPAAPALAYHLLDARADVIHAAAQRIHGSTNTVPPAATGHVPRAVSPFATQPDHAHVISAPTPRHSCSLYRADFFDFLGQEPHLDAVDFLLAHAVLDLVDLDRILPLLRRRLRPGAWLYFTINFDGATILQPAIDAAFDARVEDAYHATMDARRVHGRPSGHSQTGRRLIHAMYEAGLHVLDAGSSDWVVFPRPDGTYFGDEAYFLHFIVNTMAQALQPDVQFNSEQFGEWIELRHQQVEEGQLVYIAHQLDVLGRVPEA